MEKWEFNRRSEKFNAMRMLGEISSSEVQFDAI